MNKRKQPLMSVLAVYVDCFVFRFIEYFFIQTDRTFWGEAFIHKLIGIGNALIYSGADSVCKEAPQWSGLK